LETHAGGIEVGVHGVLNWTLFFRKSPFVVEIENTGIADGALTALSRMSSRATPPLPWQFKAIWPNSVGTGPVRSRVSARQICPLVAGGKSVAKAPPLGTKTKFFVIGDVMSEPALEVVDHVAGIQCGFTAQPVVFAGCGDPVPRTSTLFWAARGMTPSSNVLPNKNNICSFFIALSLPLRPTRVSGESKSRCHDGVPKVLIHLNEVS
jgi:hypothetical protein